MQTSPRCARKVQLTAILLVTLIGHSAIFDHLWRPWLHAQRAAFQDGESIYINESSFDNIPMIFSARFRLEDELLGMVMLCNSFISAASCFLSAIFMSNKSSSDCGGCSFPLVFSSTVETILSGRALDEWALNALLEILLSHQPTDESSASLIW